MKFLYTHITSLLFVILMASCMSKPTTPPSSPNDITGKTWKLTELNGRPITLKNPKSNPHFSLHMKDMRYEGNGSCNGIGGTFEIKPEIMRIKFNQGMSTMIACEDLETEQLFLKALLTADNYTVNGNTLSLNKAKMAPLAKFVWQK
ncbi:META domain-containing protein [Chryseobacterium polytrichastri]|uniref:Heat shock protein HslJ n=1 Tax=Chryseobacterium polytrichastri TaxID=1302687 RepID=A0A1M6WAL5_9FLAO|nr:META domain-containing protein [Chryseobacterium polytrichastri]SHK90813.1 Heat shock protein HslJ [Chryseobacterium polytrichastri]